MTTVGLILLIWYKKIKKRCTEKTIGKMIGVNEESYGSYKRKVKYYYYPQCQYKVNNKTYIIGTKCSTLRFRNLKGKEVIVYYNPQKVEDAYFEQDNTLLILSLVFIIEGIATDILLYFALNY